MLKFGTFIAPYHPVRESPLTTYERDLELIEWCDRWGFDEAWVGEHHSAAWENIADPAMFLAVAGQRTTRIKLGSGVVSLPYHHPMMVADRFVQLDYLTHGRAMLGVGPGGVDFGRHHDGHRPRHAAPADERRPRCDHPVARRGDRHV